MVAAKQTGNSGTVTVVNYHYVRDAGRSRYPAVKALSVDGFNAQLDYFSSQFSFISMEELVEAVRGDRELPPNALLLTFDDGYIDHFTTAFPLLRNRGISGAFYPPVAAVAERRVLDVNKIHFVLATAGDPAALVSTLFGLLDEYRARFDLHSNEWYYGQYAVGDRFDPPEIIFVKRLLQKGLPEGVRDRIVDRLFRQYVTEDEAAFAEELYMTAEQLTCLRGAGMHIGCHGYEHCWLDSLPPAAQAAEVERSVGYLVEKALMAPEGWTISYPYGGYNQAVLATVATRGCALGFTVNQGAVEPGTVRPLELPRFDTNDFPQNAT